MAPKPLSMAQTPIRISLGTPKPCSIWSSCGTSARLWGAAPLLPPPADVLGDRLGELGLARIQGRDAWIGRQAGELPLQGVAGDPGGDGLRIEAGRPGVEHLVAGRGGRRHR